MSSFDTTNVFATISLRALEARAVVGFRSRPEHELVRGCVFGAAFGWGLPPLDWLEADAATGDITLEVEAKGQDLIVQFFGAVTTPSYRVPASGFHWDFWDAFLSVALPALLERGIVAVHAAAIATHSGVVLLPGPSGAGKSSVAFASLLRGSEVLASELCFVSDGHLLAGNAQLTIDPAALEAFALPAPDGHTLVDGRVAVPTADVKAVPISRLVFPRVGKGPLSTRRITSRRARMLLFENLLGQHPVARLLVHETHPTAVAVERAHVFTMAREAAALAVAEPLIAEGTPQEIATFIEAE